MTRHFQDGCHFVEMFAKLALYNSHVFFFLLSFLSLYQSRGELYPSDVRLGETKKIQIRGDSNGERVLAGWEWDAVDAVDDRAAKAKPVSSSSSARYVYPGMTARRMRWLIV